MIDRILKTYGEVNTTANGFPPEKIEIKKSVEIFTCFLFLWVQVKTTASFAQVRITSLVQVRITLCVQVRIALWVQIF